MMLVVDPRSAGISGDMMLAALVDMGADGDAICSRLRECADILPGSSIRAISFREERRCGIRCSRLVLEAEDPHSRPAHEMINAVKEAALRMGLSVEAAAFAERSINCLVSAECRVHGTAPDRTSLHESSSIDTLVDIAGTAAALDQVSATGAQAITMPVNVGGGTVTFSHGTFPNPAPAVLEILRETGIPVVGGPAGAETATPTGACMLAGLQASPRPFYPQVRVERTGYGAGSRDTDASPNVLTVVLGEGSPHTYDTISVLESSVDDVSGEVLGRTISTAMEMGAADAAVYHGTGKKGRPTSLITILCRPEMINEMADMMVRQTGTLGIRITTADRYVLPREDRTVTISVDNTDYTLRYKARSHQGTAGFKIEADDIAEVSSATGMPPHQVEGLARRSIEDD